MAKSDYICAACREVKSSGYLRGRKYECPEHGVLCPDHVQSKLIGSDLCKLCERKVVTYAWNFALDAWLTI